MDITLPCKQQEWLEAQVKAGAYDSIDDALSHIIGLRMLRDRLDGEPARNSTPRNADELK